MAENSKVCTRCHEAKPLPDFYLVRSHGRPWRQSRCIACQRALVAAWAKANPERRLAKQREWNKRNRQRLRGYDLRKNYGLTVETYAELLASQNGRCAICGSEKPGGKGSFHVDHDHDLGVIRGLLCHGCNTGLGSFHENSESLERAIAYIHKHALEAVA